MIIHIQRMTWVQSRKEAVVCFRVWGYIWRWLFLPFRHFGKLVTLVVIAVPGLIALIVIVVPGLVALVVIVVPGLVALVLVLV